MHRRFILALLAAALATISSLASAQSLMTKVNRDSNVRPASCEISGCSGCGGGARILPGAGACGGCGGGDCNAGNLGPTGPCGPGGCASGDCSNACYAAPFSHCLYQNPCYGACGGSGGCNTIFGEMAMDIRRWSLGRSQCGAGCGLFGGRIFGGGLLRGGLLGRGCTSCTGGLLGGAAIESSCGCETAGCTGGCSGGPILGGGALESSCGCETVGCSGGCGGLGGGGMLRGGLFRGGFVGNRLLEGSCGCETVGCQGGCSSAPILESSCGCEDVGCTGDCGACFQDVLTPCRGRSILGSIGGLLFGGNCGCNTCTGGGVGCGCLGGEISCGVEDAGMTNCGPSGCALKIQQPTTQLVSAEAPLQSKLLTKRVIPKPERTTVAELPKQRTIRFATDPNHSAMENAIERVRYDEKPKDSKSVRFLNDKE